jgi:hypothetical protein
VTLQVGTKLVLGGIAGAVVAGAVAGHEHEHPLAAVPSAAAAVAGAGAAALGVYALAHGARPTNFDAVIGTRQLLAHQVDAAGLAARDAASATPGRWFHVTSATKAGGIVEHGVGIPDATWGTYGDGHYLSSRPDMSYGDSVVVESVQTRTPLVVHEHDFQDIPAWQAQVRPYVERYARAHPEAAQLPGSQLVRAALLDAGHDSIHVVRNAFSDSWLVALDPSEIKVVTRSR